MTGERTTPGTLPESWRVCLPVFEGPLDLLLHLVRVNEVEIADIPVARICDQFHEYLGLMEELDLDVAGEYVYEAAQLIHLKSRMLLPRPTDEEGRPIEDPRQELVQRLLEYRQYKEAAEGLREREEKRRDRFERGQVPDESEAGLLPLASVSLFALLDALDRVLSRLPERNVLEMTGEAYDIEDKMGLLLQRARRAGRLSFTLLLEECRSRIEAIVVLLALLELLKMMRLRVEQDSPFGEIWVEPAPDPGSETPAAEAEADETPTQATRSRVRRKRPAAGATEETGDANG